VGTVASQDLYASLWRDEVHFSEDTDSTKAQGIDPATGTQWRRIGKINICRTYREDNVRLANISITEGRNLLLELLGLIEVIWTYASKPMRVRSGTSGL
jgi:hypothetical protein